mgnify:CR=1 FL=1
MSFFVSEALKGRVTEENLIEDEKIKNSENESSIFVRASFDNFSHAFEIPDSYQFISKMLESFVTFEIVTSQGILEKTSTKESDFELVRQYERSCFLLKIVINE